MPKSSLFAATLALLTLLPTAGAQPADPLPYTLTLHSSPTTISPDLYGHFAEHLGRLIYDGLWVGPDSPIPNTRGIRNDVIDALKRIHIPVLRWPGGCFADEYHWRDGVGPREQRPKRVNTHWGGVTEPNAFGTHEFLDLCELTGAQPYLSANVGSGTPQEMKDWLEYMTSDSPDSSLANERRKNGREKPWHIAYLGVGNESWGCGGNMRPEFYADLYRQYQTFAKSGSRLKKIACGSNGADYNWTDVVMSRVPANMMSGISLHWYTLPTGNWSRKGPATDFPEAQWPATIAAAYRMEELVTRHLAVMDKYDPNHRVGLVVDEWGTWYDPTPGTNPGFLEQQNTLRDAVTAALTLNIFNNHADRIPMANIAQTVNVLQALILTQKEKMLLTPTYHVFEMYQAHQGATLLPLDPAPSDYEVAPNQKIPSLHASASRDKQGAIHLSLVNARPDRPLKLTLKLPPAEKSSSTVSAQILTADRLDAHNTFDHPDTVHPTPFDAATLENNTLTTTLPPKSVTLLELK